MAPPEHWDVVVIGGGGAGMSAAIAAARWGGKGSAGGAHVPHGRRLHLDRLHPLEGADQVSTGSRGRPQRRSLRGGRSKRARRGLGGRAFALVAICI